MDTLYRAKPYIPEESKQDVLDRFYQCAKKKSAKNHPLVEVDNRLVYATSTTAPRKKNCTKQILQDSNCTKRTKLKTTIPKFYCPE